MIFGLCASVADFSSNVKGKLYIIENIVQWRTVEIYLIGNVCTENNNKVFSEMITVFLAMLRNNSWLFFFVLFCVLFFFSFFASTN